MVSTGLVMVQVALGVLVSLVALVLAARTMPFTDTSLNSMHLTCLAIQSLTLFCAFPFPAHVLAFEFQPTLIPHLRLCQAQPAHCNYGLMISTGVVSSDTLSFIVVMIILIVSVPFFRLVMMLQSRGWWYYL
eukprot:3381909-Rhodomonas_salina.1